MLSAYKITGMQYKGNIFKAGTKCMKTTKKTYHVRPRPLS